MMKDFYLFLGRCKLRVRSVRHVSRDDSLIALSGLWTDTEGVLTLINGGGKDWEELFVSLQPQNE